MSESHYRTKPDNSETGLPRGIPYIVGNEAAERFSFYGMRSILTIYMSEHLRNSAGNADYMSDEDATFVYHLFVGAVYFFPIIGSFISDIFWGKYKTILILSLGYCVGHLCLALGDTGVGVGLLSPRNWLFLGLTFVAVGAGGIKPCVSAHVGDQFGGGNQHLLSRVYSWFYFSINVGATAGYLLTPHLLEQPGFGAPWAFGLPGVLMAVATLVFWMGRNRFVHVPPAGPKSFFEETFNERGVRALRNLSPLFLFFVPMYFMLFDQTGSSWVLQATRLDREFLGVTWYEAQAGAVNPALILLLIPVFSYVVYPFMGRFFDPTPLRKIGIGLFLMAAAFASVALIEMSIDGGDVVEISSQADRNHWRKIHLIDGEPEATGWLADISEDPVPESAEGDAATARAATAVVRLRDYSAWTLESVVLHPVRLADHELPEELVERDGDLSDEECTPSEVVIYAADTPSGSTEWREIGRTTDLGAEQPVSVDVEPVSAKYVKLELVAPPGAVCVGLNEVEVLTSDPAPSDAPGVWPNVAAVGVQPSIGWQFLAYVILTASEIMVSIVCLEFAYTQAPLKMKSFIMGIFFLGVSLGNFVTAAVNHVIANEDGTSRLQGAAYFWFFALVMLAVAFIFVVWSRNYRGQTYIQGDPEDDIEAAARLE